MPRCTFCKQNYEFPYGLSLILNDGNIMYFCSSKCRKNALNLKRDNKKVNWIRKADAGEAEALHAHTIKEPKKEEKKEERKEAEKPKEHKEEKHEEKKIEKIEKKEEKK